MTTDIVEVIADTIFYSQAVLPETVAHEIVGALAAANLTISPGWQDIETAPKDGKFDVFIDEDNEIVRGCWFDMDNIRSNLPGFGLASYQVFGATHWRPQTTPPTE